MFGFFVDAVAVSAIADVMFFKGTGSVYLSGYLSYHALRGLVARLRARIG